MDKQRVLEIAQEIYDAEFSSEPAKQRLYKLAAAILLEAADICQQVSEGNDTSAEYCQYRLEQLAEELTQ